MKKYLKYIMILIIGLFIFNGMNVSAEDENYEKTEDAEICKNIDKKFLKKVFTSKEYEICRWEKVKDTGDYSGEATISINYKPRRGNWIIKIDGAKYNYKKEFSADDLQTIIGDHNTNKDYKFSADSFECPSNITNLKTKKGSEFNLNPSKFVVRPFYHVENFTFKFEEGKKGNLKYSIFQDMQKTWINSFQDKIKSADCSEKALGKLKGDITVECNFKTRAGIPKDDSGLCGGYVTMDHNTALTQDGYEKCLANSAPLTNNSVFTNAQNRVKEIYEEKIAACGDCAQYADKNERERCEDNVEKLEEKAEEASSNANNLAIAVENAEEYVEDYSFKKIEISEEEATCEGMLSKEGTEFLKKILKFVQYGGVIVALLSSTLDFIKSVSSGSQDDLKKSFNRFLKRMIFAALLFFVVLLTNILLGIFNITVPSDCI